MSAAPFDLLAALPEGTTVLEASAGTGKTFTIAGLVARYVAEGVARLDELLVVTFGRAATQELRDRVRERLVTARDGLADPKAARARTDDELLRHLASGSEQEVAQRRRRLALAVGSFDAATVVTTHQFCQQVLIGLGTAGDVDAGAVLVENLDDLITEVVADLYLRKWGVGNADEPSMNLETAQLLARTVVKDGQAALVPNGSGAAAVDDATVGDTTVRAATVGDSANSKGPPNGTSNTGSNAAVRARFAVAVRREVERRKRAQRILGFDDLLTRLKETLADPVTGPTAAGRLRNRYRIVLVDEFQDTDPVQWDVLRLAFHGAATLVLIGDPKQAIYAFRGADVRAYLAAAQLADHSATLARNWRSDPDLLAGLDALFRGAALGDRRIVVAPVSAAYSGRMLSTDDAPVRLRMVGRGDRDFLAVGDARELVTADVVSEIVALLDSGAVLHPRDRSPARPVQPADIAVIVRTNAQLELVHAALLAAGVPSVQRTTSSVFGTPAGADWIVLLEALEQPHRTGRVRRLAVSPFVGWDAADLESGLQSGSGSGPQSRPEVDPKSGPGSGPASRRVDQLSLRLRHWLRIHDERGIAALFETISRDQRLPARLLGQVDGERRLTDLRHVGEALHAAAMAGQLGLTASLEWLRRRVTEAGDDVSIERSRRLDSDDAAVQVVTIHASKGLEFPIVHVPFGWDRYLHEADIPLFHRPLTGACGVGSVDTRMRNVGGAGSPGFADDQRRHRSEELGEDLRLLYVALTRAQAQVTAWWAPSKMNTPYAPLHRLLFTDAPHDDVPEQVGLPGDAAAFALASTRAVDGCLSVTRVPEQQPARWRRPAVASVALATATLGRTFDTAWRRTSYTALTAGVHDRSPMIGSEPESEEKDDEPTQAPGEPAAGTQASRLAVESASGVAAESAGKRAAESAGKRAAELTAELTAELSDVASPMDALPGGAAFGTLVHAVLERTDPMSADLAAEVQSHVAAQLVRVGFGQLDPGEVATALLPSLQTPLGALTRGRALCDIAPADRLVELNFELPLRGGDRPNGTSGLGDLAAVLRHHLPAEDPMAAYADQLDDPVLGDAALRGYLTGSIDAVLRVDGRYVVVDYKTNRLGAPDAPLTAQSYRGEAMAEAMLVAHYPLQALLYEVALHRFLRWRLADYDPQHHLGGVLYLFLRGMCGPGVVFADGTVPGVFAWQPAPQLVVALSDALADGVR